MQLIVNVPDADAERVVKALCAAGGVTETPNVESARKVVGEYVKRIVVSVEAAAAHAEATEKARNIEENIPVPEIS